MPALHSKGSVCLVNILRKPCSNSVFFPISTNPKMACSGWYLQALNNLVETPNTSYSMQILFQLPQEMTHYYHKVIAPHDGIQTFIYRRLIKMNYGPPQEIMGLKVVNHCRVNILQYLQTGRQLVH